MVEREQIIEIVVAVTAVFLMIGTMVGIGVNYGGEGGTLSETGGEMLIGAIVGFVVLMTLVGVVLAFVLNDSDGASDGQNTA